MTPRRCLTLAVAGLLTMAVACGGADESATEASAGAPQQTAPPSDHRAALDDGTLAAYERGLKREIEAVRAAQERSSAATTPQERGDAMQASFEHATLPLGAEAAGLPPDRYREVRETINGIFRTLDFQGKIDGPLSMDLSRADAATKARLVRDPFDDLPPESAAALRSQMDRLVPIWIEYVRLTAVAG